MEVRGMVYLSINIFVEVMEILLNGIMHLVTPNMF